MASLLSRGRTNRNRGRQGAGVTLTTTVPNDRGPTARVPDPAGPRYGWQLLAVGGALASALAGWVIVAGLSVIGWLAAGGPGRLSGTLHLGTRLWLLANGTPAQLGSVRWSLVPLGCSLLIAFMVSRCSRAAVRFAEPDSGADRGRVLWVTAALTAVTYAAVVAAVGLTTGAGVARGIIGAAVIAAAGSLWGGSRALGLRLAQVLPAWARPLPAAVAGAVAVLLLAGLAVLATGIVLHADRIGRLSAGLGAGAVGGIALWAAQAAFLPTMVVWCSSYALGAGFTIGQGSIVAPSGVSLGILPSVPILGALPGSGAGSKLGLLWLAAGVVAGVVAAVLVVRRRPAARFDETALVGGLAGVLAALVFTGLALTTRGDLGDSRLAGAGPRLPELLVMTVTVLGLSGTICGFVLGLLRRPGHPAQISGSDPADDRRKSRRTDPGKDRAPAGDGDPDHVATTPLTVGTPPSTED